MRIAFIIPCLNEAAAISNVVADCRKYMPGARVYVLDNGSEDGTRTEAILAGATVIDTPARGKGNVIRHAFQAIDADYFILVDGDGSYPISEASKLVKVAYQGGYDMVTGSRLELSSIEAFRRYHHFGNIMLTRLVRILFRRDVQDLLTGYRVFSRSFTQEIKLKSKGFEIETELTLKAILGGFSVREMPIFYQERTSAGKSKLRTFRDGFKILFTILKLRLRFSKTRVKSETSRSDQDSAPTSLAS